MRIAVLLASLVLLSSAAIAQNKSATANQYHEGCRAAANAIEISQNNIHSRGMCLGMAYALLYYGERLPSDHRFCAPRGVNTGQVAKVIAAYFDKNPGQLHQGVFELAVKGLREAWPC